MHHLMVGVRIVDGRPEFFGWDMVNEYIRHGMRVMRVEPGGVFGLPVPEGEAEPSQSEAWYFTVVLDDYGIDPAEPGASAGRGGR
jgi:hypothetical protein